ncbi:hypothetical protein GLOIN_2v1790148 [Rhizophagus irregularis DAOM 181602=DAOM 197198]|nr:hypothetical protein GLOIN_2v1790148 [Rhizophagus irregularis DAOM 181602=DAOM 197198]
MSSYKTETKTGLPVKYLKYTKESLWEKFSYQFPDGVKRTSFMMFLQGKQYIYQENLGGLCSICSHYGYEIFVEMKNFIEKNIQNNNLQSYEQELEIAVNGTVAHNACISHCLPYAFGTCTESHSHECVECGQLFAIFYQLKNDTPITLHNELEEYQEHLLYYLAHQTRKVYLNTQFNANLLELDEKGALIVVDYKMKVLPKSARETKEQFFGKKGWTLHSVLVYTRKEDSFELDIQAHDHWSNDPRQDAWFTASNNGGHYHNADLMMTLRYWQDWYGIWPKKWIFLEPGEAKTTIDSHHAQIAHSINRYVKLGFDISSGKDIENAISGICGTSVSHLEPVRTKEPGKRRNQLPGISNLNGHGQLLESMLKLEKLQSKTIEKPDPNVSTSSIPKNPWTVPLPNDTGIQVKKLKKNHVKEQLEIRGILKDIDTNKRDLVKELEIALAKDTLAKIPVLDNTNLSSHDPYSDERKNSAKDRNKVILDPSLQFLFWPLACGWALKSAQKYGKKGSGKRISKKVWNLLQEYFLEGNVNKSERHTAESMLARLKKNVEDGVIEEEEVPKLETIRNWISRYTSQHRQESAIVAQASKI